MEDLNTLRALHRAEGLMADGASDELALRSAANTYRVDALVLALAWARKREACEDARRALEQEAEAKE